MTTYRVFYTVTYDGCLDVEADSPSAACKEVIRDTDDRDLTYGAERENLTINDVQDPETGGSLDYDPNEDEDD